MEKSFVKVRDGYLIAAQEKIGDAGLEVTSLEIRDEWAETKRRYE
jgi:hypothetical protein